MQAVSVSFFRFDGLWNRLWVLGQMGAARFALRRIPGLTFFKLFGSGTGEGFTPIPNWGVYAILAVWPDLETAQKAVASAPVYGRWRRHASEAATLYVSALSSRGRWDGSEPFAIEKMATMPSTMAILTRATIKKRHALAFWRETPDISGHVREQPHLKFKIGLGEVPLFQQVTFSVWDDAEAMKAFAYRSAFHGEAVKRVRANGWFKEELYARFAILAAEGRWEGRDFARLTPPEVAPMAGRPPALIAAE